MRTIDREIDTFPDRAEWLAARTKGIGSSDAPAILGLSRYSSPLSLYHEKRGVAVRDGRAGDEMREIGLAMEPVIARLFERDTKRQVYEPPANTIIHSAVFPWMIASLDRWQIDPARAPERSHVGGDQPYDDDGPEELTQRMRGVLELKNVSVFQAGAWLDAGEVPLEYLVQVQHQLAVTGAEFASIAAIIGGTSFKWADIPRDDELISLIQQREVEFWGRVIDGRPPEADGSDATRQVLRELAGTLEPKVVESPIEFVELDEKRTTLKAQAKLIEDQIAELDNTLMAHLVKHSAQVVQLANGVAYSLKQQHRAGYTVAPATFPVLRRKAPKGL